jgi:hypothetical protein
VPGQQLSGTDASRLGDGEGLCDRKRLLRCQGLGQSEWRRGGEWLLRCERLRPSEWLLGCEGLRQSERLLRGHLDKY